MGLFFSLQVLVTCLLFSSLKTLTNPILDATQCSFLCAQNVNSCVNVNAKKWARHFACEAFGVSVQEYVRYQQDILIELIHKIQTA
jgi:hypothetical protein